LLGAGTIATIPGRGYRFEAVLDGAAATSTGTPTLPLPPGRALAQRPPELLGRDNDLASLQALLGAHRLVTICGPGGIGKTRLARAALWAARANHPDGVAMVELAALSDPALIPGAIATALELPLGQDPLATMHAAVRPLRMLLLLDNAEQLSDGVRRPAARLWRKRSAWVKRWVEVSFRASRPS
ncbi:MAG: AAA family ATPase, partial [Betaproteobacteria bacterium]